MPNVLNVSTGKPKVAGAVFVADLGVTLPTDATTGLAAGFSDLGYVSDDGVTNTNTPDTEDVEAWGGQVVLTVQTSKPDEFSFTLIEALNGDVLGVVYGDDNVTVDGGGNITVQATGAEQGERIFVIDMILRGGALKRIVIPNGKVKEVGDIVYRDDEAIGYAVTIAALPNSSGVTHFEYITPGSGGGYAQAISLDKSTASVAAGYTTTLVATTTPLGGRVVWATSDPEKATVNSSGVVTGVAAGSAVITAIYGGLAASCSVTVT